MILGDSPSRWLWSAVTSTPPSSRAFITGATSSSVSTRSPITIASLCADVVERRPGAECETGLDFDAADSDMKVLARHVESDHASGQIGSGKSGVRLRPSSIPPPTSGLPWSGP